MITCWTEKVGDLSTMQVGSAAESTTQAFFGKQADAVSVGCIDT
jgi:hypothetical protein